MRELRITIEINGKQETVGYIRGSDYTDARFCYDQSYLSKDGILPISVSLPLQEEPFSSIETSNFFEGLLPEGFSRRSVAGWVKTDENNYLEILEKLGKECLGAISVISDDEMISGDYELLTNDRVKALAAEGATTSTKLLLETHLSLTGASGKVGLYYDDNNDKWYLPVGTAPSSHIVKQSHVRFNMMVLNEQICIETARNLGIEVPESFVINTGDGKDEDILYATKRYDRDMSENMINGLRVPLRRHQEDFAQALGIPASKKYETGKRGYLKQMFDLVVAFSANPIQDQLKLWDEIIFNYLIGNADCHLKNYSLLYSTDMRSIRLAPAYDIVCTKVYGATRQNSLFIGDKSDIDEINRSDFEVAANEIGLGRRIAMSHFDDLKNRYLSALDNAINAVEKKGFAGAGKIGEQIINATIKSVT